ncbi:MAG: kelch repeat-containing protein, partial [Myxococcota bacterium]
MDSTVEADASSNASDVVGEQDSSEANVDTSPDPMSGTWGTAAPMTVARQETSVVAMGGEVWVLGGFDDRGQVVATLEAYNPATNTWRSAADIPTPMHHSNAAAVDGKLVVVGFLVGFGFLPDGRTYMYDPATDTWSERAPMPDGTERGGSGVAVVDGQIYVVGGLRSQATTLFSV